MTNDKMKDFLTKDSTAVTETVQSQAVVGAIKETDSRVLEGSHGVGDHHGQAQGGTDPLAGNDVAPRKVQDADGLGA